MSGMSRGCQAPAIERRKPELFPKSSFLTERNSVPQTLENCERIIQLLKHVSPADFWTESAEMGQFMLLDQIELALKDVNSQHNLEVDAALKGVRLMQDRSTLE